VTLRLSRPAAGLALAVAAGLLALPACDKKDTTPTGTGSGGPPPGYSGSKGGPPGMPGMPGGPGMPPGGPGMPPGGPGVGQPNNPTLPTPPKAGPLYQANDFRNAPISKNNLRQIGLAFHNAAEVYRTLPVGIGDKSGKVGLSWRVAILPYIEQENLYKQFKLDEPWDSEHNKKLIPMMPKTYAPPNTQTNGYTYYRSFTGPDAVLPPLSRPAAPGQVVGVVSFAQIPDGTVNTFLVAEATEPVIWTKPDELPFDKTQPPPKLGDGVFAGGFHAVMCDGSVRFVKKTIGADTLKNAINRQDGQIINLDK
jgi:hypothetical protein